MSQQHKAILQSFSVLGLRIGAPLDEIRHAYRDLVKTWHPDVYSGEEDRGDERIKAINAAFALLKQATPREIRAAEVFYRSSLPRTGPPPGGTRRSRASRPPARPRTPPVHRERPRPRRPRGTQPIAYSPPVGRRGRDLLGEVELTPLEAAAGARWKLTLPTCRSCGGWGIDLGTQLDSCIVCHGLGFLNRLGRESKPFVLCPSCGGQGCRRDTPCRTCGGGGSSTSYTVCFSVPAGIGRHFCGVVDGLGHPGVGGAPSGNLYLLVV